MSNNLTLNTNNKLISCIQDGIEIKRRYNHEKDNSSLKHILFLNEVISYDINPKTNLLDQITIGLHDINLEYNNNQLTKKTFTSYLKSDEINMDNLEQTIQLNCTPPQKLDQLKLSDFYYNINRSYNEKRKIYRISNSKYFK